MGFRLRRSARLGPLRFNFSKGGLSSISVGGRGASFNIPVSRRGGARTTVGRPGTGLSWSVEHAPDRPAAIPTAIPAGHAAGLPNSRRLRPGQLDALKQSLLGVLHRKLFAPGSPGEQLWEQGLVSRLLADSSLGAHHRPVGADRDAGINGGLRAAVPGPGRRQAPRPALHHCRAGSLKAGYGAGVALLRLQGQVPIGPVPRIRPHLRSRLSGPRMEPEISRYPRMREVVFPITAPTLEELQHESLIEHLGPAHCTVRVSVRRGHSAALCR